MNVSSNPKDKLLRIQTILVPTDFSEPSVKALRYAKELAEQFDAKLILLHVIEPIGPTPDFATNPLVLDPGALMESAQEGLRKFAVKEGIEEASAHVRHGVPYDEISQAANELRADLICIATHGYTGLKHMFMGSTAERVVRHAPIPVLVVRADK